MCQFIIERIKEEIPAVNATSDMKEERERDQELHGPGQVHPEPPFHDSRQKCQQHRDKSPGGTSNIADEKTSQGKVQEEDLDHIEQIDAILPL